MTPDRPEGAHAGFLHHIFGIRRIADEPMRQRIGITQMGNDHLGKPLPVIVGAHPVSI
jgi:hypothetical protein